MQCVVYLCTSSADTDVKAGIPVQRAAYEAYAMGSGLTDDDVLGILHMHARQQGKLMLATLLADGVKCVLVYDGKRLDRSQLVFWRFVEMCSDLGQNKWHSHGSSLALSSAGGSWQWICSPAGTASRLFLRTRSRTTWPIWNCGSRLTPRTS